MSWLIHCKNVVFFFKFRLLLAAWKTHVFFSSCLQWPNLSGECDIVHSIIHSMYKTPQHAVTFLLEAGGTSLVVYGERCVGGEWQKVGRTMLWIVTPFPRGICNTSSKSHQPLSRWLGEGWDDLARSHRSWLAGLWNHGGCEGAGVCWSDGSGAQEDCG